MAIWDSFRLVQIVITSLIELGYAMLVTGKKTLKFLIAMPYQPDYLSGNGVVFVHMNNMFQETSRIRVGTFVSTTGRLRKTLHLCFIENRQCSGGRFVVFK